VAPPIVSEEASFLTKLLSSLILALEKDREMVTASGRPSGIATTITVMAMMIVFRRSVYSLFGHEKPYGWQIGSSTQLVRF